MKLIVKSRLVVCSTILISVLHGDVIATPIEAKSEIQEIQISNSFAGQICFESLHLSLDPGFTNARGDYIWGIDCYDSTGLDMLNSSFYHGLPAGSFVLHDNFAGTTNQTTVPVSGSPLSLEISFAARWTSSDTGKRPIATIRLKTHCRRGKDCVVIPFSKVCVSSDCEFALQTEWGEIDIITTNHATRCATHVFDFNNQSHSRVEADATTNILVNGDSEFHIDFFPRNQTHDSYIQFRFGHSAQHDENGRSLHDDDPTIDDVQTSDALGRPVTRNLDAFGYNARGEVAWARYGTNTLADLYFYDPIGNFTSNRLRGAWTQFAANELNEYATISDTATRTLAYDLDGNLLTNGVWSYSYDSMNRLIVVCSNNLVVTENAYDPFYRRVFRRDPFAEHNYLYDDWSPLRETIVSAGMSAPTENYWGKDISGMFRGAGGAGGLLTVSNSGNIFFPTYDCLGNAWAYQNACGGFVSVCRFDIFGQMASPFDSLNVSLPHLFSTKQFDFETGLYDYGFRFYVAEMGRWGSRDKIEETGGVNLFCFCSNRPLNLFDKFGLSSAEVFTSGWNIEIFGCGHVNMTTTLEALSNGSTPSGGTIVQNVKIQSRVRRCGTNEEVEGPDDDLKYHEAFFPGTPDSFGSDPNDLEDPTMYENTYGYIRWDVVAQFYPEMDSRTLDPDRFSIDFTAPWLASPGGYGYFSGDTQFSPVGSGLKRWFVFRWNCCDCPPKTSYSYGAISTRRRDPEEKVK